VTTMRADPEVLKKREDGAVQSLKAKENNRNRSATKEGQAIFDWFIRQ
jgi:Anticodon-binding domain